MDEKKKRTEGTPPNPRSALFWADLGYTLVREIVCACGHKNKVEDDWHTGLYKVECSECFEELDIERLLRVPDRKPFFNDIMLHDTDNVEVHPDGVVVFNVVEQELAKPCRRKKKAKGLHTEEAVSEINNFINSLPDAVADEVRQYAKFLEEQDKLDQDRRKRAKSDYDKWIADGDRRNGKK